MRRIIEEKIKSWALDKDEWKPLFILGARQVGKTYSVTKVAEELFPNNHIYINFLKNNDYFNELDTKTDPAEIIAGIQFISGKKIDSETLIIFDEVQQMPSIKTSLKNFVEDKYKIKIICLGSYLGNFLNNDNYSFPVGKTIQLYMYPLSFYEFVDNLGYKEDYLSAQNSLMNQQQVNKTQHYILTNLLHDFMIIGGMPEVVQMYLDKKDEATINLKKETLMRDYLNDISKYEMKTSDKYKAKEIFENIPLFLSKENKKYMLSNIDSSARYINYAPAIQNLLITQIVYKINNIKSLNVPLKARKKENEFKIYYNDCGFVATIFNLNKYLLVESKKNIYSNEKGALAENFILSEINKKISDSNVFYYSFIGNQNAIDETKEANSRKSYEIDYVVEDIYGNFIPIEVKFGKDFSLSSLKKVINSNKPEYSIVLSSKNFSYDEQLKIYKYPLYFVSMMEFVNNRLKLK